MKPSREELQALVDLLSSFGRKHGLPTNAALATEPVDRTAVRELLIELHEHLEMLPSTGAISTEEFPLMAAGLTALAGTPSHALAAAILAAKVAERAEADRLAQATGAQEIVELLLPKGGEDDW